MRSALYSILRFIARHVRGFFAAIAAFLTVGLLAAVAAMSAFAAVASAVTEGFTQSMDESVLQWLESHRSPLADRIMLEITTLGTGLVLVVMVLIASVFLWLTQHRWSVYVLLLGVLGGKLVNGLLKEFYERPRPSVVEWGTQVSSPSFPSGHAMSAMVGYGCIAYLVTRLEPTRALQITTWILTTIVILAIGLSRMYLGVHYPSDIVAGYIGGLAWLAFVASTLTAIQFFADRRPETRQEEHDLDK